MTITNKNFFTFFFYNIFSTKFFPFFASKIFCLKKNNKIFFQKFFFQFFIFSIIFFFKKKFSIFFHRRLVQKPVQHGVPNDLTDVRSKNLSNTGSRMTLQMFGPKTCPTRGPERPFRCLDVIF